MQFLINVIDETTGSATSDEMAAIDVFNDRLVADGAWIFAGGLASPAEATVVDNRGTEALITDGPFLESKEYVAGFWIIQASDAEAALRLATEASRACNRRVELRTFLGG